jgi:DNA-3-methyladenine glycosylase I
MKNRCGWPGVNELMITYHDTEWGVVLHDDHKLFEFLLLDNAQAGLSWQTILNKRENYRKAFDGFDPAKVRRYNKRKIESLLKNPGIIRNRLKVEHAVTNARAFVKVQEEFGTFDDYIWRFVAGEPIRNKFKSIKEIPATSAESI